MEYGEFCERLDASYNKLREDWKKENKEYLIFCASKIDAIQCIYNFLGESESEVIEEVMPYVDTILVDLFDWGLDYNEDMYHDWESLHYLVQDFIDEKNKNL